MKGRRTADPRIRTTATPTTEDDFQDCPSESGGMEGGALVRSPNVVIVPVIWARTMLVVCESRPSHD